MGVADGALLDGLGVRGGFDCAAGLPDEPDVGTADGVGGGVDDPQPASSTPIREKAVSRWVTNRVMARSSRNG